MAADKTELMKIAKERVTTSDPATILTSLGIDHKTAHGGTRYQFSTRGERTASSFISNYNGTWRWKDFGDDTKGGSIIDVVMDSTNQDFKSSLLYCLETLGMYNEAEQINGKSISQEEIDKAALVMNRLREENRNRQENIHRPVSKVISDYPVATNESVMEYLSNRGIENPPSNLRVIIGEYQKDGKVSKRFGVGVLTLDGGADIHFLKKLGDLKSMRLGSGSDISYFKPERAVGSGSNPIAIFESKMDWAAATQVMDLKSSHIYIANSTSNAKVVSDHILKNIKEASSYSKNIYFFNQNDRPAYSFVLSISSSLNISDTNIIKYHLVEEYGKDINDLLLDGVLDKSRFTHMEVSKIEEALIFMDKYKKKMRLLKEENSSFPSIASEPKKSERKQRICKRSM